MELDFYGLFTSDVALLPRGIYMEIESLRLDFLPKIIIINYPNCRSSKKKLRKEKKEREEEEMEMQLKQDQAAQTQAVARKSRPVSVSGFFFFFFSSLLLWFSFAVDEHTFSVFFFFFFFFLSSLMNTHFLYCRGFLSLRFCLFFILVVNRVLETQFPCRCHVEKVPHQTWTTHKNRVPKTRFIDPKSSLLNSNC